MMITSKLLLLVVIHHVTCHQHINVTIMVPGIVAFRNFAEKVYPGWNGEPPFYYDDNQIDLDDVMSNSTVTLGYYDETFQCLNGVTNFPDVRCLYDNYYVTYPWSYVFAKPALDIAMETIKRSEGLLDGFDIALRYYDSGDDQGQSSARLAQIAVVDSMMNDHMTALIGPMNAYAMSRVSSLTAHWRKLSITPGAISTAFRKINEEKNNTLTRTGPVASGVGDCVASILRFYNWTSTAVQVFEDGGMERVHYFTGEGVYMSVIRDFPRYKMEQERLSEYVDSETGNYRYDVIMENIRREGRVIVISAEDYTIRDFMIHADKHGLDDAYAYVIIDLDNKLGTRPWETSGPRGTKVTISRLRKSMENALIVTLQQKKNAEMQEFISNLKKKLTETIYDPQLNADVSHAVAQEIVQLEQLRFGVESAEDYFQKNQYPAYLHDSLLMLAHVLNNTLHPDNTSSHPKGAFTTGSRKSPTPNSPFPDGLLLRNNYVIGRQFAGVTGTMLFNKNGDRRFNFSIWNLNVQQDEFQIIGEFDSIRGRYYEHRKAHWRGGAPPLDVPECGFDGKKCAKPHLTAVEAIVISVLTMATVVILILILAYRRHKLKKEQESQLWRVCWSDVTWPIMPTRVLGENLSEAENPPSEMGSLSQLTSSLSPTATTKRAINWKRKNARKIELPYNDNRKTSAGSLISERAWGGLTTIGLYKDKTVVLKLNNRKKVELTREILMELKHMRDVTYEHLTRFEGACLEWPHICILTEYCGKGSLKDILLNEEITMDWMFRVSLMNDLVKGMRFLHGSAINCHGNLKSTNCVVDSRFVLKITDYGLKSFRNLPTAVESERECEKKLWTAPELLNDPSQDPIGTQKGDVYSFGIILQEIALRKGPFYIEGVEMSCREIISKVRCGFPPYFRPMVDLSILSEDICNLMQKCWNEDPDERPDFISTKRIIEKLNKENPGNLVENLLHRMEQYAINLEGLVEERTAAYMEEKQKADDLLYQMLPVPVVDRLKRGDAVPAEAFESVTICFTDIVGFTSLSAASSPMQIVSLLNDLYTCFDAIIDNFDVYKVETIGDAYMLVSGLPVRNGIRHAREIARTALALLRAVSNFKIRHRPGDQLKLRIGIHTGPCCAGVVGLKMPRYCLFGDTVNTASRMESNGVALAIHVSDSTKKLLDRYQSFQLQLRGDVPMKGKGALTTYWLVGEVTDDVKSIPSENNPLSADTLPQLEE